MSDSSGNLAARLANLSPEKRALLAKRLEARSAGSLPAVEPVAVIGMACRFPHADGLEAFWSLIRDGGDAIDEVPADRWDTRAWHDADPARAGKIATRWGGFLSGVDQFDAEFFGISPREAARMDPQQRILLEVAWDALEHAGQTFDTLAGTQTGVYVGVHSHSMDYAALQFADVSDLDGFTAIGTAHSVLAGRLSYWLDLQGPSLAIDTACSSSLVAVHYACQALRARETTMALAAGVNLILSPDFSVAASRMHMLSPDGRCRTFDASANGFVRGEGVGVVLLKRLEDAVLAGDRVLAVIRGTAVNQDGRTNGIAAPNGASQRAVVEQALLRSGLKADAVTMIEAHGTGTPLGDPIEVEALAAAVGGPSAEGSCALGSVKANIGHLEGAAGIAGLIKTVLCLQHRQIPPIGHFTRLNPHIDVGGSRLVFPTRLQDWRPSSQRIAGVSSFGFSGTNAHVIVESAPPDTREPRGNDAGTFLVPISARSRLGLASLVHAYRTWLGSRDTPVGIADVAAAAGRRQQYPDRAAFPATSVEDLAAALEHWTSDGGDAGPAEPPRPGGIVFVFPGQGSQALGMGSALMSEPVFAEAIYGLQAAFAAQIEWSLVDVITGAPAAEALLARIDVIQPALFAIEVALARLWESWGVRPESVIGHSMGEVAAAHIAGGLSLTDAARVICRRSALLHRTSRGGAMALVELPLADAEALCETTGGQVSVAASNSSRSTVIAGAPAAIDAIVDRMSSNNVFCRRIKVDVASHSPQMDALLPELRRSLVDLQPMTPQIPFVSTVVTGETTLVLDAAYWAANLRRPVMFADAVRSRLQAGDTCFIEMSPHPTLVSAIIELIEQRDAGGDRLEIRPVAVGSLHRERADRAALLGSLAAVYAHGVDVSWADVNGPGAHVDLPVYPWQRQSYWIERRTRSHAPERRLPPWTYRVEWIPQPDRSASTVASAAAEWLVLGDPQGMAGRLALLIAETGAGVTVSSSMEDGRYDVDGAPLSIVDLRTIDAASPRDVPAAIGVVHLCQSVRRLDRPARIWVVTSGAVAAADVTPDPTLAAVWGVGRVASLEDADVWGGLIDLDPNASPESNGQCLLQSLRTMGSDDQVAWRAGCHYVPRLTAWPLEPGEPIQFLWDASYLITGGLGRLGLVVAAWMASRGAGHLILVSRRPMTEASAAAIREIEGRGARVTVVAADVADESAMRDVVTQCGSEWPPLRGVMHLAGVIADTPFTDLTSADLEAAMRPKMHGARVLDAVCSGCALDWFVLFGSGAGVWGSRGAAAYAAANAALDAMAFGRRRVGRCATVVDWGWWAGGNTDAALDALFAESGLRPMAVGAALDVLGALMKSDAVQCVVIDVDWARFRQFYGARRRRPFLDLVAPGPERAASTPAAALGWRAEVAALPRDEQYAWFAALVRNAAAETLGYPSPSSVDPDRGFFKLGMDSLMTVQLRGRLSRRLAYELPSTVAFEYPTVHALARYLFETLLAPVPPSDPITPIAADLATASEADLADLLDDAIARLERTSRER